MSLRHPVARITASPPTHLGQNSITQIKRAIIIAERTPSTIFLLTLLMYAYMCMYVWTGTPRSFFLVISMHTMNLHMCMHLYIFVCENLFEGFLLRNGQPSIFFSCDPNEFSYLCTFIYICAWKFVWGILVAERATLDVFSLWSQCIPYIFICVCIYMYLCVKIHLSDSCCGTGTLRCVFRIVTLCIEMYTCAYICAYAYIRLITCK